MNIQQARQLQKDLEKLDRNNDDEFDDEEFIIILKNYVDVK